MQIFVYHSISMRKYSPELFLIYFHNSGIGGSVRSLDAGTEEWMLDNDRCFAARINDRMIGMTFPSAVVQQDGTEADHGHSLPAAFAPCAISIRDVQFAPVSHYPVSCTDQVGIHVVITQTGIAEIAMGDIDRIRPRGDVQIAVHAVHEHTTIHRDMHRMIHAQ